MRAAHLRRDPERERIRCAAISAFNLGRKRSAEACANIGAEIRSRELGKGRGRLPGYKQSAETIAKRVKSRMASGTSATAVGRATVSNRQIYAKEALSKAQAAERAFSVWCLSRARMSAMKTTLSAEQKAKISAAHLGRVHSPEARQRMREAQRRPEVRAKISLSMRTSSRALEERAARFQRKSATWIELAVRDALTAAGVAFLFQHPINRWMVDFFLPEKNLILECDGDYWHSLPGRKERDEKRDQDLAALGYRVVHLPEHRIKAGAVALLEEMVS